MHRDQGIYTLLFCAIGIYSCFLTWALVQEPLNTKIWPASGEQFQAPSVIAIAQAIAATFVGFVYLYWRKFGYKPSAFISENSKELALISFTQSTSTPFATYSLQNVDYLTYMLAKSCKMIPILLVHLIFYRTPIPRQMKLLAVVVSLGVAIFTIGGSKTKTLEKASGDKHFISGFGLLLLSLFLDGMTNATQDKLLKKNKDRVKNDSTKTITGAHLMFALNIFIILWNILYLFLLDPQQLQKARQLTQMDPQIIHYLLAYAFCGAIGQGFIFFTLEKYGSLVLVMITVTRKMISMVLSILVFGKKIDFMQWIGILIVFSGITFEAIYKRTKNHVQQKKKSE